MKEFIENLICTLEEQKTEYRNIRKNTYCRRTEMDDCDSCRADHYLDARLEGINKAIKIVNELAEEYKDKDCSKCSRRSWYQIGYSDAEKKFSEENNGGCCEWKLEENNGIAWHCADEKCSTYNSPYIKNLRIVLEDFECICPYCGKKIKVIGVEGE